MKAKYKHTNIIAKDWKKLSQFYQGVFGCRPAPPERSFSGKWLEEGTGVISAALWGEHLRLPGCGESGPTLEIFQYSENLEKLECAANRLGFGHLAFEVENVLEAIEEVQMAGGSLHGKCVSTDVQGVGTLTFAYVRDPEDNLIELQSWS
ncbi:MAG: glyoxalase [Gammaproteobacteria bacterium 39-13]|nr:VOC family protein [Gammaproteobacteria bacterium]OJV92696.1 MAG: glyoxalase [Gammaproteobacteria bacterium 39-13]